MSRLQRAAIISIIFMAASVPARADWYVTPYVGVKFGTSTTFLDIDAAAPTKKFTFGGTVTELGRGVIGVEGDFSLIPGFFQREASRFGDDLCCLVLTSRVTTLMGNVVTAVPLSVTGYWLRPYASGGAGLIRATETDILHEAFKRNLFGINVGGGVIGLITNKSGLRFDVRYFRSVRTAGEGSFSGTRPSLSFWRGSIGVLLKF